MILFLSGLYSMAQHKGQSKDPGHHKATVTKASTHIGGRQNRYHYSLILGLGSASYYGQINSNRLAFQSLNYKISLALVYRFNNFASAGISITHFRISASDAVSGSIESGRKQRNLSFATPAFELGFVGSIDLLAQNWGKAIDYPELRGVFPYAIGGAGFLYFEPTAELQGQSYNLRTTITTMEKELGNGYGPLTFYFTGGLGARVKALRFFCFGIDLTYTYTLSDNLDDLAYNTHYPTKNKDSTFMFTTDGKLADRGWEVTEVQVGRAPAGDPNNLETGKRTFSRSRILDGYFMITLKSEYAFQAFNNFLNKKNRSHFGKSSGTPGKIKIKKRR
ncbi:MAG: hypothetical protein NW207_03545 [Cytophagales bacterium]|nr:hypothetical protein [Cytophagales bacterium]